MAQQQAQGEFEVKLTPQDIGVDPQLGRMLLDKQFHGELQAQGLGQMLSAGTGILGSAGYVAIERVTGSLHGRSGSFVLQHSGTMDRGKPSLRISVVPDSGTDELKGLSGTMEIKINDGKHFYSFDYALNPTD